MKIRVLATKNAIYLVSPCCKSTPMSIPRTTYVGHTSIHIHILSSPFTVDKLPVAYYPSRQSSTSTCVRGLSHSPPSTASLCPRASGLRNDRALSNNLLLVIAVLLWLEQTEGAKKMIKQNSIITYKNHGTRHF